jgi:predicted methyltransferase
LNVVVSNIMKPFRHMNETNYTEDGSSWRLTFQMTNEAVKYIKLYLLYTILAPTEFD